MSGTVVVNATVLSVNLVGLEEGVSYTVRVRAETAEGSGPYSEAVLQRTFEDCKSFNPIHL